MFDIVCITNRNLCSGDFLTRIEEIAANQPAALILREKDLNEAQYVKLAEKVMKICERYNVNCILHCFAETAAHLGANALHMPLPLLKEMTEKDRKHFSILGASCHSPEEALEAQELGCTYITASHIFKTSCKEGLPEKGIDFLQNICRSRNIPVYALGGINQDNICSLTDSGAAGACIMSGFMQCENVNDYFKQLRQNIVK